MNWHYIKNLMSLGVLFVWKVSYLYQKEHTKPSLAQLDLFFFYIGMGRKGSGEHRIALLLAYPISHLKGSLCAASGMLISLNDVIMLACNLKKDYKVVRNARPTNTANTISHHCSLISQSIQVSCNLFNNSAPRAVNSLRHSGNCAVQFPKSGDRPTVMIY